MSESITVSPREHVAEALGRLWWLPLLRGLLLIILGGYALFRPGMTAVALTQVVAIFVIADGILAIIAGILDAVVVNPSYAAPVAVVDTRKVLWEVEYDSEVRRTMMFLQKVVATPVVFLGHWAFYSLIPTSYRYKVPDEKP